METRNTVDILFKDLFKLITLDGKIRLHWEDTGEVFTPTLSDLSRYADFYVTELYATDDCLNIRIQKII